METTIERDAQCFCCGAKNERGLHLVFNHEGGRAETSLEVPEYFSGWSGIAHGGFLSMLLDEAMAHACLNSTDSAVTGEITIRFAKPVRTGSRVRVTGKVEQVKGRVIATSGVVYDEEGNAAAEASARFVVVKSR